MGYGRVERHNGPIDPELALALEHLLSAAINQTAPHTPDGPPSDTQLDVTAHLLRDALALLRNPNPPKDLVTWAKQRANQSAFQWTSQAARTNHLPGYGRAAYGVARDPSLWGRPDTTSSP